MNQNLLLTKPLVHEDNPTVIELNHTDLWVQIYDLPIGLQFELVIKDVGNFIGVFVEADVKNHYKKNKL